MIELSELAIREETRQADGLAEIASECVRPASGGTIARGDPGSWVNNAVGMGLGGPVEPAEIDGLVDYFASKGIEPRIELCPFAGEAFVRGLGDRGFVPRMFENVFFREINAGEIVQPIAQPPEGLVVEMVDITSETAIQEFAMVSMSGFVPRGYVPPPSELDTIFRSVRHPRTIAVVARLDGRVVGAGSAYVSGDIASLGGLSVLDGYRRRGVQQSLIAARLNLAAERGARLSTIGSKPGAGTERNVRRMGYQLGYTKVHVVRPGAGLTPNMG